MWWWWWKVHFRRFFFTLSHSFGRTQSGVPRKSCMAKLFISNMPNKENRNNLFVYKPTREKNRSFFHCALRVVFFFPIFIYIFAGFHVYDCFVRLNELNICAQQMMYSASATAGTTTMTATTNSDIKWLARCLPLILSSLINGIKTTSSIN